MFTGIVSDVGTLTEVSDDDHVRHFAIACGYPPASLDIGASVAINGVCLTVVDRRMGSHGGAVFEVDASAETLAVSTAGGWSVGTRVNLERALRAGDELGGHLVSGHVDGIANVVGREDAGGVARFTFAAPEALARFIAPKGSVALDGTSLTVNGVVGDRFDCMIIPHTLKVTTWGARAAGDRVNIEVDTVARYVARLLAVAPTQAG